MNLEVARALLEKLERDRRSPSVMPATVVGLDDDPESTPVPLAHVTIDGNPPGRVNVVPIATAGKLAIGQRVLVHFDPPAGAYVIGTITRGAGGTRPYSTLVIAAADSIATDAENADFVCDGVDDHEEIVAALAATEDGYAARVLLLDGQFECSTNTIVMPQRVVLAGLGRSVTRLSFAGTGAAFQFDAPWTGTVEDAGAVEDCRIYVGDGSILDVAGYSQGVFRRCTFEGPGGQ